ncbi:hypothetical protein [Hafnia sp.]|uniref:hypothetical protein n=1 Tax=Hafnia sp. TaxID=1873498 RepID=UPI002FC7B62F
MNREKTLLVKGSAHCATLRVMSLLFLGVGGMLLPIGEARAIANCSSASVHVQIPEQINITGKSVGAFLGQVTVTNILGVCSKPLFIPYPGGNEHHLYAVMQPNRGPIASCNAGGPGGLGVKPVTLYDASNSLSFSGISPCFGGLPLAHDGVKAGGNPVMLKPANSSPFKNIDIILNKSIVGSQDIDISNIFSQANAVVYYGFGWNAHSTPPSFVFTTSRIKLINNATCSASVNNVTFPGTLTSSAIVAGTVTPQTATVNVSCNDILPKYTVRVSSPHGTHGNARDGVIKSNNATIGYRLSWKEGQVATAGSNIQLDSVLTPKVLPVQNSFTLPISVRPLALVPQANVKAGSANSAIKIDLTFN